MQELSSVEEMQRAGQWLAGAWGRCVRLPAGVERSVRWLIYRTRPRQIICLASFRGCACDAQFLYRFCSHHADFACIHLFSVQDTQYSVGTRSYYSSPAIIQRKILGYASMHGGRSEGSYGRSDRSSRSTYAACQRLGEDRLYASSLLKCG